MGDAGPTDLETVGAPWAVRDAGMPRRKVASDARSSDQTRPSATGWSRSALGTPLVTVGAVLRTRGTVSVRLRSHEDDVARAVD